MTRTDILNSVMELYGNLRFYSAYTERLYHCKADIIQSNFSKWIILRSYSTIVAAYDKNTEILYVFGYYSNTTCQHVAKFKNWLQYELYPVSVKRINLYNDSKIGKRIAADNKADDFASVIANATEK